MYQQDILTASRNLMFKIIGEHDKESKVSKELNRNQVRKIRKGHTIQIPLKIALFEWEIKRLKKSIKGLQDNENKIPANTPSDVCFDMHHYIRQHEESLTKLEEAVKKYYKERKN